MITLFAVAPAVGGVVLERFTSSKAEQVPDVIVQRKVAILPNGTITPVLGLFGFVIVAEPLISVQTPVPTEGVLAAIVKFGLLHCGISAPASAVMSGLFVKVTSSVTEHIPFDTVHLTTVKVPTVTSIIVELKVLRSVIVPSPLTIDHDCVVVAGVLPFNVNVLLLHCVWSMPASAEIVLLLTLVKTTSSMAVQPPFVTVHLTVTVAPKETPDTVVLLLFGLEMVAVPLTTDHVPVAAMGDTALILNVALLQAV